MNNIDNTNNNNNNNNKNNELNKIIKNTKKIDLEENENFLNNSCNSPINNIKQINKIESNNLNINQTHKVAKLSTASLISSASNGAEPRKMQAERSLLLQDLSQSKLLNKYKSENKTTAYADNKLEHFEDSPKPNNGSARSSIKNSPIIKPLEEYGGIYGADSVDCGGVYGASTVAVVSSLDRKKSDPCTTIDDQIKQAASSPSKNEETINTDSQVDIISKKIDDENVASSKIQNEETPEEPKQLDVDKSVDSSNFGENSNLLAFTEENLGIVSGMRSHVDDSNCHQSSSALSTPRKIAFNPLSIILKDKNKYYTTEYI